MFDIENQTTADSLKNEVLAQRIVITALVGCLHELSPNQLERFTAIVRNEITNHSHDPIQQQELTYKIHQWVSSLKS